MKDVHKILIALFILIGLAIGVSYKRKSDYEKSVAKEEESKLVDINLDEVKRIDIQNPKGTISFERRIKNDDVFADDFAFLSSEFDSNPNWLITKPVKGLPDFYQINNLVSTLKGFSSTKMIDETGERLDEYGLKEDAVRVDFYKKPEKEKPSFTLWIGDENSGGTGLYAKTSKEKEIVLANFTLRFLRDRPLEEWRKKEILGIKDLKNVQSLKLSYSENGKKRELALQKDKAKWFLTKPIEAKADFQSVENLLSEIKSLRANKILSEDVTASEKQYGLDEPYLNLTFSVDEHGDLVEKSLRMGSKIEPNQDVYVTRSKLPQVFAVRPGIKNSLTVEADDLISKNPFSLRRGLVSKVVMNGKGKTIELIEKEGRFYLEKPVEDWADPKAVTDLFDGLLDLQATKMLEETPKSLGDIEILIQGKDREESISLKSLDEGYEGQVEPSGLSFVFPKADVDALFRTAEDLREKRLTRWRKGELESVLIKMKDLEVEFVPNESAGWETRKVETGNDKLRDQLKGSDKIESLIEQALELKADAFIDWSKPKKPELELQFVSKEEDHSKLHWFFQGMDQGRVKAWSDEREHGIEISGNDFKELMKHLRVEEKKEES